MNSEKSTHSIRNDKTLDADVASEPLIRGSAGQNQLLSVLGHALRTPIATMDTSLRLLKSDLDENKRRYLVDVMDRQLKELTRLVDELLDLGHLIQGRLTFDPGRVDLRALIKQGCDELWQTTQPGQRKFEVRLPRGPLEIQADPARINAILANLLSNAVRYTDENGRVELSLERRAEMAVLSVSDDGLGLAAEYKESIFEPFVRAPGRGLAGGEGLGLGLTLVRALAALHRGQVEALSDGPGRGSTFIVTLPALPETVADVPRSAQRPAGKKPLSRRILLVEDHHKLAELTAQLIGQAGHGVDIAGTAAEALKKAKDEAFDLILCDLNLPDQSGVVMAERLRATGRGEPRLVALTAHDLGRDLPESARNNFDSWTQKPLTQESLDQLLEELGI